MIVKRSQLLLVVLCCSLMSFGQQLEHYTQYQYNQFLINPALTGYKKCIDIKSGYRFQWIGIDGAPRSGFVNVSSPIKLGKRSRSPNAVKYGIGAQIKTDALGPWKKTETHVTFGAKFTLSRYTKLSYGISAGMKQIGFNSGSVTTTVPDPAVFNAQRSLIFPDAQVGIWLTTKKAYYGASIHNLFGNAIRNVGDDNSFQRHYYFTAGQKFKVDNGWYFIPSVMVMKTKRVPFDGHLSFIFDYENTFALGIGLRRTDAITAQIRFKLFDFISIGYSFDYIISKLQNRSWQTQEITMGYNSCSGYGSSGTAGCPTFE